MVSIKGEVIFAVYHAFLYISTGIQQQFYMDIKLSIFYFSVGTSAFSST